MSKRTHALRLVPVTLDLNVNGRRLYDKFCWSSLVKGEELHKFAVTLLEDKKLPPEFAAALATSIDDYIKYMPWVQEVDDNLQGQRERLELIQLDFRLGSVYIKDQFMWDVFNPDCDPESFAAMFCKDLKLDAALLTPLTHEIRWQIFTVVKSSHPLAPAHMRSSAQSHFASAKLAIQ
eukprot:gene29271-36430_t